MSEKDLSNIARTSDLEASIQALQQTMDDDPTSEKPLDALIQVEEALRTMLDVKELSKEIKAEIDRVLMGLTGLTISAFLDEIHEKAMRAMNSDYLKANEDLEEYLKKLKIVHRKVERVILYPDAFGEIIPGSGKGVDRKQMQTNKLQHLLELLRDNEIYTDDICIITGENSPNMMREGSYLCVEIPKIKRTIMFHCGYGEASFVLYDIYDRKKIFDMTKERMQQELGATKVIYSEDDIGRWKAEMIVALRLNDLDVQPKVNIKEYDERLFYVEEIKREYSTPEEFMGLNVKQKGAFKIQGKGLTLFTTKITGQSGLHPVHRSQDMAMLARAVYGDGHKVIECEFWDIDRWIEETRKEYPTPEEFMGLNVKQKRSLKIQGKGLFFLATKITRQDGLRPVNKSQDMAVLARAVYGEGHEVIENALKEDETELWDIDRWIEEIRKEYATPEELMDLTVKQKEALKIQGKGLFFLATKITGQSGLDPIGRSQDMAMLARVVYGEGHEIIECEFWDIDRWIEEIRKEYATPGEFMGLNQNQKLSLKIQGKGLFFLATKITGQSGLDPIGRSQDMAVLAQVIYGDPEKPSEE